MDLHFDTNLPYLKNSMCSHSWLLQNEMKAMGIAVVQQTDF